ncbi:hypothetical protein [Wenzhouxiangella sp. EGI_FJ10305]|uniref:hypothetical protein n=1 Tax=Wenzhouxiangella sp. EGI_FJ10305 TaxID=3243768 RepID=UPI0035DA890D
MNKGHPTLEMVLLLAAFLALSALPLLATESASQPSGESASTARLLEFRLQGIDRQAAELAEQAQIYLDNPPREYDLYFRDAVIVDAFMTASVDNLESAIGTLADRLVDGTASSDSGDADELLAEQVSQLEHTWTTFRQGLEKQLGVDPEMPRLEWGYEHIAEGVPEIRQSIDRLSASLEETPSTGSASQPDRLHLIAFLAALALAVIALLRYWILTRQ